MCAGAYFYQCSWNTSITSSNQNKNQPFSNRKRVIGKNRQFTETQKANKLWKEVPPLSNSRILSLRNTSIIPNYSTFSQTFLLGTQPWLHIQPPGSFKKLPKPELHLRLSESESPGAGTQEMVCLQALPGDLNVQPGLKATANWNLALPAALFSPAVFILTLLPPLGWRQERCSYFSLPLPNHRHTCSLRCQLSISHYQTTPSLILLLRSSTWHPQPHSLMVLPRGCDTLSNTVLIKMHNLRNQKIPWDKMEKQHTKTYGM